MSTKLDINKVTDQNTGTTENVTGNISSGEIPEIPEIPETPDQKATIIIVIGVVIVAVIGGWIWSRMAH